jgi:PAS domain S-box-containing protein
MAEKLTHRHIFEWTSNGALATDGEGIIRFMNPRAERILSFDAADCIGRHIVNLLPLTGPLVMTCIATGEPQLGKHILGFSVNLVVNATAVFSQNKIIGAVCDFQEMGQFEQTATQLASYRRLNRQLETIFKASSDGIWVCDASGEVINVNDASRELNGIESQDIVGKNIRELLEAGMFDRSVTLEVLETRRQVSVVQYIGKTGKYLLSTGTPVFDDNGNISMVVVNERDMTQLSAIQEQLEQHHMAAEKMKDELAELSMLELKEGGIVAESEKMKHVLRVALKLARLDASNILILGESGVGKGLIARFIHQSGHRQKRPFIQINCAALPESLLEAELFGYEQGAFTGARRQGKIGLIELAHEGTLFLDEIGDLPLALQAKLLKYLDDQEVMRLGGLRPKKIDCSVVAATNKDLAAEVGKRRFRRDLFYRLNTFTLSIPPLRERPEDIFELVNIYLARYNRQYDSRKQIQPEGLEILQAYAFPGNVRELKGLLKKAVVMCEDHFIGEFITRSLSAGRSISAGHNLSSDFGQPVNGVRPLREALDRLEKEILSAGLRQGWTTRQMAANLGISQTSVVRRLKKHALSPSS